MILILPYLLFAKSATLTSIIDGDSVVLKDGKTNVVCHLGDLDALEVRVNSKLKREMRKCKFSKKEFLDAGLLSLNYAKSILKIGTKYEYTIERYFPNKNPVCHLKIPKGLHVELSPYFDKLMISSGFALPYVIYSEPKYSQTLLKLAKEAKKQKKGLWKSHFNLMKCLVEQRYSLRSLR